MKAILKFIHEARTELIKVSWPSRQTAINLTLTVIAITLVSAIFIGGVDYLLTQGVKGITFLSASSGTSQEVTTPPINLDDIQVETTPVE
jgi:preprotein translocase subunit SecE